jgi:hypothetical protein
MFAEVLGTHLARVPGVLHEDEVPGEGRAKREKRVCQSVSDHFIA